MMISNVQREPDEREGNSVRGYPISCEEARIKICLEEKEHSSIRVNGHIIESDD